ncbi:CtsR family transcriptional regulator [Clostridium sp. MSJ-4]|uniref:Transcriptional regulator CtsR n=1 Tax=Clostridium simiarum TaxID=2841506 RepID=A0ABS6EZP8_9CLOT|nr:MULTISPECIES: CtsR family transcriptional regulator [Clostridium]MBU5591706.1 CtsR family transcriptional regulator [Clostridium simiarum]
MARLSDIIEDFIKSLLEESEEKELQIQRNELATHFSCAPSQINYVLTTRFTTEKGYIIESRRGGGGYIIIKQVRYNDYKKIRDIINQRIGDSITYDYSLSLVEGLIELEIIGEREGDIIKAAMNDRVLSSVSSEMRNKIRSDLLKSMIMVVLS